MHSSKSGWNKWIKHTTDQHTLDAIGGVAEERWLVAISGASGGTGGKGRI